MAGKSLKRRESNPFLPFRESASFCRKFAAISALTAFAQNEQIADSRRITQFACPKLSETALARVRVIGFEKVGTGERPPTIPIQSMVPCDPCGLRRRESAVEDFGTDSCPLRADAGKAHCGVLEFYAARDKARCFA